MNAKKYLDQIRASNTAVKAAMAAYNAKEAQASKDTSKPPREPQAWPWAVSGATGVYRLHYRFN